MARHADTGAKYFARIVNLQVCCRVRRALQRAAVRCIARQCVAAYYNLLQCVAVSCKYRHKVLLND